MSDHLHQALAEAQAMPDGEGKAARLEALLGHIDATGDDALGLAARYELIRVYNETIGRSRMLPPFAWCLAAYDRNPEIFDPWDKELLRWYYKWAIVTLLCEHRVGLAQTQAALDDMQRRFTEGGHSMHAIYSLRSRVADHIGDSETAQRWFQEWRIAPRDENSDCEGCDPTRQALMLAGWGQHAEAIKVMEPVLSGAVGCPEQPEKAMARILVPFLKLGRFDDAAKAHVRAYRRHRHEIDALVVMPDHLMFCALTGHHERGLDLLAEHLAWLERPYDEHSAMEFAAAGALVARLATEAGSTREVAGQSPAELEKQLAGMARDLAAKFDARNGTDRQSRLVEQMMAEQQLTAGLELPPDEYRHVVVAPPPEGLTDLAVPLSTGVITAVLQEREDRYRVLDNGVVTGEWDACRIAFTQAGEDGDLLQIMIYPQRAFQLDRRAELFEFANAWNHDKLLPKAYVHIDEEDGDAMLIGEVNTDLRQGVTLSQLGVLIHAAIMSGSQFANAVISLP